MRLDLERLPIDVRVALEAAVDGDPVVLTRAGAEVGTLVFHPDVVEGVVVTPEARPEAAPPVPDGVTVVATAMKLSARARQRLSDELGSDYIVLDITEAPETTDVLLIHPVSPQLLGILRSQFPQARVVITEIEDEELGIRYVGPVSRLLDAGASAYLPPRPIAQTAANVHAYLTNSSLPALEARRQRDSRSVEQLPRESD